MSNFVFDLWDSIFTPGTTPTLVYATHGSFVCLTLVLIGLLVATHNLHFVALLTLTLCLWVAITWFVAEVEAEQKRQQQAESEVKGESKKEAKVQPKQQSGIATASDIARSASPRSRSKKT